MSALGEEISGVRERLDDLVAELDRRRHALRNWTRPPVRQTVALVVITAAAWALAPRLTARYWPRRSRRG